MAQSWEDSRIQELGNKYKEMAAAGAPGDVLQGIHNQAERIRNEMGYTGGNDGSKSGSYGGGYSRPRKDKNNITVIGSDEDFNSSSYDYKPDASYSSSGGSGRSLDGGTIAGYVITGLVLVVILDKLVG